MRGVRAVALSPLLCSPPGCCLGRLGEMHLGADTAQLLDDKPPARGGLQRDLELLIAKTVHEASDARAVRWRHASARDLAGRGVDPLGGYLCSVLIKSH